MSSPFACWPTGQSDNDPKVNPAGHQQPLPPLTHCTPSAVKPVAFTHFCFQKVLLRPTYWNYSKNNFCSMLQNEKTTKTTSQGNVICYLKSWEWESLFHWGCFANSFLAEIQRDPSLQSVHDRLSCWVMTLRCWCSRLSVEVSSIGCCSSRINWLWHQDLFIILYTFKGSYWICEGKKYFLKVSTENLPCFCNVLLFSIVMWHINYINKKASATLV